MADNFNDPLVPGNVQPVYLLIKDEAGSVLVPLDVAISSGKARLKVDISSQVQLQAGDIQIGAVELKNADTDDRTKIALANTITEAMIALAVKDPALGLAGDAEAAAGNGTAIAILKNLRTRLGSLETYLDTVETLLSNIGANTDGLEGAIGTTADAEVAAGNGTQIAILKNLRTRLGNLETYLDNAETLLTNIGNNTDGLEAGIGAPADAEAAAGNGSTIALLKNLRTRVGNLETYLDSVESLLNPANVKAAGANGAVADTTAIWANSVPANTEVNADVPAPTNPSITGKYLILVHNPSGVTALTGKVRVRWTDSGANARVASLIEGGTEKTIAIPAGATRAFVVEGWVVATGGRIVLSNDTVLGAADGFTAYVQVRAL